MEKKIFEILNDIGMPCHINGRAYTEEAIKLALNNNNISVTKELYPQIAQMFNSTPARVERSIRYAIRIAFSNSNNQAKTKYFGNIIRKHFKITNHAFICGIVKYLKNNNEGV